MRKSSIKTFVTGQQVGRLSAIYHANKNSEKAVCWIETNDADFNEINRIDYINLKDELVTLKWYKNSQGLSCGHIVVVDELVSTIKIFLDTVKKTEYTSELKESVLNCYRRCKTLGEASTSLAKYLFDNFGIEIFDPDKFRKINNALTKDILAHPGPAKRDELGTNMWIRIGHKKAPQQKKSSLSFH